ncbi:MAG: DUF2029 domain-containing protein [Acetobacteraceae bacterium]|nr:DUF2029 domain-containing protein [Acetobacteraceae bacterium]
MSHGAVTTTGWGAAAVPKRLWRGLAHGSFASVERAVLYGYVVCGCYGVIGFFLWLHGGWPIGADGFPVEVDFVNVWAAGLLAANGEAAAVYDLAAHKQAEVLAIGRDFKGYFHWLYPPMFLFAAAPLSFLPYLAAWFVWSAIGLLVLLGSLRLVLPAPGAAVGALAAPATLFCAMLGQNGLLTAGLMAAALALLDRRPWLSGVLLGLLTYKPQFGVLFPLVLLLTRRWKTFSAAAATALAFAGASPRSSSARRSGRASSVPCRSASTTCSARGDRIGPSSNPSTPSSARPPGTTPPPGPSMPWCRWRPHRRRSWFGSAARRSRRSRPP